MIDADNDNEITMYDLVQIISPDIDNQEEIIRGLTSKNVNEVLSSEEFI